MQGKNHGQLPKLRLSQQYRRRVLVRGPQLSPQAFEDQVAIRFHIGRRRFCENMILPEIPFQSDQFLFIGHVTVNAADDCLVFRISVKAAEVDPVNVHDRHVVPPLRFVVDRNDFLAVVPPVILGVIVRGLDLKDGCCTIRQFHHIIQIRQHPGIQRVLEHEWPAVDLIARLMGEDLGNQRLQQSSNLQLNPVFGIIRCDDIQLVIVEIPPGTEW